MSEHRANLCLATAHLLENLLIFTKMKYLSTNSFLQRLATSLIKNVNPASNLKFSGLIFQPLIPVRPSAPVKVTF